MICKKCLKDLPEENFNRYKTGTIDSSCKKCRYEQKVACKRRMDGKTSTELGISMKWKHYED